MALASSTGFRLAGGSILSPDGSLLSKNRWLELSLEQRRGVTAPRRKLDRYQANGPRLGWLPLPEERPVEIWNGGERGWPLRRDSSLSFCSRSFGSRRLRAPMGSPSTIPPLLPRCLTTGRTRSGWA
ncbi:MAG: hypothetical protein ACK41W_18715 [Cyanobacteriota bacterium]|jgi:hypothetical protein